MKRLGVLIFFAFCVLSLVLAAFWYITLPPSVKTATVSRGKAVEAVYATAVVEPVTWSAIAPVRTGRIIEINAHEGERVEKGDVLARLDDEDLRAQLTEEQALTQYHESQVKRSTPLVKTGATSKEEHERRQMDLARSSARLSMIEEQIKQLSLTAPMDGTVLWRDVELGEVKEAGKPLFWVGEPRPLRLEAEVDEEDIPKITTGQPVLITADAFPAEALNGTVNWISPKGDPVNKSYRVYMGLPEDTKLMIGMTVETNTIVREKDNVLLVPAGTVTENSQVWLAVREENDFIARKTPVKTGIRGEEKVEIIEGVKEGDTIILPPFNTLTDGAEIRIE